MTVQPLGPDAEVLGGAISGLVVAINSDNIIPHLKQLDMLEIQADKWYPKQKYIDLWNALMDSSSSHQDFVSIGMTIAETAWPPEADNQPFDSLIEGWEAAFDAVNRGADRGYVRASKVNDDRYTVSCRIPEPDYLNYGIVYGFCKRFLPENTHFIVKFDPDVTHRDQGGYETVFQILLD